MFTRRMLRAVAACIVITLTGCASYVTPGRGADLSELSPEVRAALTDGGLEQTLDKKPLAKFPTAIAVVRIQAGGYCSRTTEAWGGGRFSVVTTRDVENDEHYSRLENLPMVLGIAPVNRLLLPSHFESDLDLRKAAAALHADVLLIYTLDTSFYVEDMATPLSVLSLGLSPNQKARVATTASAILLDTRNGYVYGLAEATEKREQLASAWTSDAAVDQSRLRTETAAFGKLVGEVEKTWSSVLKHYAGR